MVDRDALLRLVREFSAHSEEIADALYGSLEEGVSPDTMGIRQQLLRLRKLQASVNLLPLLALSEDALSELSADDLEQVWTRIRVAKARIPKRPTQGDLNDLLKDAEKEFRNIVHPLEVVGKWPPDGVLPLSDEL